MHFPAALAAHFSEIISSITHKTCFAKSWALPWEMFTAAPLAAKQTEILRSWASNQSKQLKLVFRSTSFSFPLAESWALQLHGSDIRLSPGSTCLHLYAAIGSALWQL